MAKCCVPLDDDEWNSKQRTEIDADAAATAIQTKYAPRAMATSPRVRFTQKFKPTLSCRPPPPPLLRFALAFNQRPLVEEIDASRATAQATTMAIRKPAYASAS